MDIATIRHLSLFQRSLPQDSPVRHVFMGYLEVQEGKLKEHCPYALKISSTGNVIQALSEKDSQALQGKVGDSVHNIDDYLVLNCWSLLASQPDTSLFMFRVFKIKGNAYVIFGLSNNALGFTPTADAFFDINASEVNRVTVLYKTDDLIPTQVLASPIWKDSKGKECSLSFNSSTLMKLYQQFNQQAVELIHKKITVDEYHQKIQLHADALDIDIPKALLFTEDNFDFILYSSFLFELGFKHRMMLSKKEHKLAEKLSQRAIQKTNKSTLSFFDF